MAKVNVKVTRKKKPVKRKDANKITNKPVKKTSSKSVKSYSK